MATIQSAIRLHDGYSPIIKQIIRANQQMVSSLSAMQRASNTSFDTTQLDAMVQDLAEAEVHLSDMEVAIGRAGSQQIEFNRDINNGTSAARSLKSEIKQIAGALGVGLGVKQIVGLSDQLTGINARINLFIDDNGSIGAMKKDLMDIANETRTIYTDTAQVVSKLGITAAGAFRSNDELLAFVEQLNKNLAIGGASKQEQSAARYQLTQAMQSNRLQGDEFRSIIENAPLLANAIKEYMEAAGVEGTLKDWASDGIINAQVIKNAMFAVADETNAKFAEIPMTWAQIGSAASNSLLTAFTPALEYLGSGAQWVYDNWGKVVPVVGAVTGAYVGLKGAALVLSGAQAAANVQQQIATVQMARAQIIARGEQLSYTALRQELTNISLARHLQNQSLAQGITLSWEDAMAKAAEAAATRAADGALKGLNATMMSSPWGIAIQGAGMLLGVILGISQASKMAAQDMASMGAVNLGGANTQLWSYADSQAYAAARRTKEEYEEYARVMYQTPEELVDILTELSRAQEAARNAGDMAKFKELQTLGLEYKVAYSLSRDEKDKLAEEKRLAAELAVAQMMELENKYNLNSTTNVERFNYEDYMTSYEEALGSIDQGIKDLNLKEEDLSWMTNWKEREAVKQTIERHINITVQNENHISKDVDADGIIKIMTNDLAEKFADAVNSGGEGVHL